jgi:hypothetical protein
MKRSGPDVRLNAVDETNEARGIVRRDAGTFLGAVNGAARGGEGAITSCDRLIERLIE